MNFRQLIVPAYLLLCVILGGASAAGYLSNLFLQLLAIPLLVASVLVGRGSEAKGGRSLLMLVGLVALLFAVQVIPLPPALWTSLPGREPVAEGFRMLAQPLPWLPLSLTPEDTMTAGLWLLPAVALLFAVVRLSAFRHDWLAWSLAGAAALSVFVGALQVAGGNDSAWYFYRVTNRGVAVGFFANTNHLATLLLATIPFLTALQARRLQRTHSFKQSSGVIAGTSAVLLLTIVGLLISTSLAGLALALPVLIASIAIIGRQISLPLRWVVPTIAATTAVLAAAYFLTPLRQAHGEASVMLSTDLRSESIGTTLAAAKDYFPFGSGIGSFQEIYRTYEDPAAVTSTYWNHAHSDYAEILLDAGAPAILLVILFLLWWLIRLASIWHEPKPDPFAQAATVATAAILIHSIVDYPLRTVAIAAIFAVCCGLMTGVRPSYRRRSSSQTPPARHLSAD